MLFGCVITYDRRFRLNGENRVFVNQVSWPADKNFFQAWEN